MPEAKQLNLGRLLYPVFIGCTLLLIAVLGVSLWGSYRAYNDFESARHTKNVLLALNDLLKTLVDAETSQRGFIITGSDRYIERYTLSLERLEPQIELLRDLITGNAQQEAQLAALEPLIREKLAEMSETVATMRSTGFDAARGIVLTDRGKTTMDQIRQIIREFSDEEEQLLEAKSIEIAWSTRVTAATLLFSTLLILLVAGAAGLRVRREIVIRHEIMKRLEQYTDELNRSNQSLEAANADLQHFAYIASHDLQEPLRSISGYVQLLGRRYKEKIDDKGVEYIEKSVAAAKRMQQLIEDMLAYSRLSTKAKPMDVVPLASVVDDALANLDASIKRSNAGVTRARFPAVQGDRSQLLQLFQNLLGNAIKFRGERKPEIKIDARKGPNGSGEWTISIGDNGIGFDPQYADRIFLMFQRLHTRQEYQGTGVGLAICKKIVERHGGRIWVESTPGEGTTFYFTLKEARGNLHD
ncbi:MAG: hypothetical protein AMXMBFR84_25550 [Candidatus Hydrogenedentota bacterium]